MNRQLYDIARNDLERCIVDGRIVASPSHYSDYWARDTFWAIRGAVRAGFPELAKSSLQLFLDYQRADGKIPRKLAREYAALKYTTGRKVRRRRLTPVYRGIIPPFHSMDGNALLVIAFSDHLAETGDTDFCARQYHNLKRAIAWYEKKQDRRGLIVEYGLANWLDSVVKGGCVLYTNVVYAHALSQMASLARSLGRTHDMHAFTHQATRQRDRVRTYFWRGSYFADTADDTSGRICAVGNLLAAWWAIAEGRERRQALETVRHLRKQTLLELQSPRYGVWRINPLLTLVGAGDYHNGASWLWVDILYAMAEAEIGHPGHAKSIENVIVTISERDREIGETYFSDGSPYQRRFWHTASPFAWASGLLLEYMTINKGVVE